MLLEMTRTHIPVLAGELIDILDPQPGEVAVDCTFGAGGHARLVAERIGASGTLICIDRDPAAAEHFEEFAAEVPCATRFVGAEFSSGLRLLRDEGLQADMTYLDLGVSSMQLDAWERGFSYSYDAPLDMRMDPDQDLDAGQVVNEWDERRLANAFRTYGDERFSKQIAHEIERRRRKAPLETTSELVDAIRAAIPARVQRQFGGGHPAKRVFQAIRIVVNDELGSLDQALPLAWDVLRPSGRLGVISFHSLEDRRVKRFMADLGRGCICPPDLPVCVCGRTPEAEILTSRAVAPTPGEIAQNPRSKSAKFRAARKLEPGGQG
jgi:16S rRNA (cytosine1402-N4)-methyltransferase